MTIHVLAVDDQPLMLEAFHMVIESQEDMRLLGTARDGQEALSEARRLKPDVVLMDIRMPVVDGVAATRQLTAEYPEMKVLVLTTFDLDEYVIAALRGGASGFLLKDVQPDDLVEAIRIVARGDALLAPSVTRRLLDAFADELTRFSYEPNPALDALTDAETRILALVGRGLSNEEIAKELFVSDSTVRTHIRHILSKLSLRDRIQAVVFAYDAGIVQPSRR
jgi:DNA-binding NarL/FixJ family response regulator